MKNSWQFANDEFFGFVLHAADAVAAVAGGGGGGKMKENHTTQKLDCLVRFLFFRVSQCQCTRQRGD